MAARMTEYPSWLPAAAVAQIERAWQEAEQIFDTVSGDAVARTVPYLGLDYPPIVPQSPW